MLFNSFSFLAFIPIVLTLYVLTPVRFRWALLLAASYYFYASWNLEYLSLILLSTTVDYFAAILMAKQPDKPSRRKYLYVSLAINLGLLFTFKYFGFFTNTAEQVLHSAGVLIDLPELKLLLPVGISFYTFQTLSYSIDVYRGQAKPERHFGRFALFVCFFPQLVAGPIERASRMLPQLQQLHLAPAPELAAGVRRILLGLVKKVVVADRIGFLIDPIFQRSGEASWEFLLLAAYGFMFQIYFDFAGYCDIAIGAARMFGVDLSENFKRPFFAQTIQDFWRRWHITLMIWFRDYLYVPIAGLRAGPRKIIFATLIIFAASGLWHGASMTFVVWGLLHGVYVSMGVLFAPLTRKLDRKLRGHSFKYAVMAMRIIFTFHLVVIAEVFFRAKDLASGWGIVKRIAMFSEGWEVVRLSAIFEKYLEPYHFNYHLAVCLVLVGGFMAFEFLSEFRSSTAAKLQDWFEGRPFAVRQFAYLIPAVLILAWGRWDYTVFVYFQF